MGTSAGSLLTSELRHCSASCADKSSCSACKDGSEEKRIDELYRAVISQDVQKALEILAKAPALKEQEVFFPVEQTTMSAFSLALNRSDVQVTRALLGAGVSPNLPLSDQLRSVYARRLMALKTKDTDEDYTHLVPCTHFEALCSTQHKELFMLLLEYGANPNSGVIHVSTCGDLDMLAALLDRGAEPNTWLRSTTPLLSSVKSHTQPYDKVLCLLRHAANPNFVGRPSDPVSKKTDPAILIATRRRDYRMVRILLGAGADVNQATGDESLPNSLFFATHWGEIELIKIFIESSKSTLDLGARKTNNETVMDVAEAARSFSKLQKPKHISKLPLPNRPPAVYERIIRILEEYAAKHPSSQAVQPWTGSTLTGSTPPSVKPGVFSADGM
jgi:ankyrin repeat protein